MKPLFVSACASISILMAAQNAHATPKELGDVRFGRDLDAALGEAKKTDRAVLILFDEIPGCSTCQGYGDSVLRHPLIVEAAETLFVPVAIYNNLGGKDRDALEHFGEPSWNNPVVRIVDPERRMLAPRVNGDYTTMGLSRAMVAALEAQKKAVPAYLRLFAEEAAAAQHGTARAYLSMYCFWTGEACLGDIEGVIATRTGYLEGHEAVEVEYDPSRLSWAGFLKEAKARNCASRVFARTAGEAQAAREIMGSEVSKTSDLLRASEKDDKYNLAQSAWRFVPMTRTQQSRANALVARGRDPSPLLSPRQLAIHRAVEENPSRGWEVAIHKDDLGAAFAAAERAQR
jgi:thioredoxin family protein